MITFEERKTLINKSRKLVEKSQKQINTHPFVIQKRKLIDKHNSNIKKLLDECTHEKTEKKETYVEGTYYDKAFTRHWEECLLCGKAINHRVENHSWYG